jgi:hypothetical protein
MKKVSEDLALHLVTVSKNPEMAIFRVFVPCKYRTRTALGPTQPPIQCVPGVLSLGVKRPRHEADHSPPSSSDVKE